MDNLQRLEARLPVKQISRRQMYLFKLKTRLQDFWDWHFPIIYRYFRKIMNYLGIHL